MTLDIKRKGMLLVLSGPSGSGKGTLGKRLLRDDPNFYFSVSATTRKRRFDEVGDKDYHFISDVEFDSLEHEGAFLETAVVHGHKYGTLLKPILDRIDNGIHVLLDIDTQGAMNVIKKYPDCVSVFILPPSWEILENRLHTRNTENHDEIQKRLRNARQEILLVDKYDYVIINDIQDDAYINLANIVKAEKQNTKRFIPTLLED